MKPSERIEQLHSARMDEVRSHFSSEFADLGAAYRAQVNDSVLLRVIVAYLDEQHELSERRECVRFALAMIVPGSAAFPGYVDRVNNMLKRAGLTRRVHYDDDCALLREYILDEARAEGLVP